MSSKKKNKFLVFLENNKQKIEIMDPIYVRSSSSEEDEDMPEQDSREDFDMTTSSSLSIPDIKQEISEIIPKDNAA